jgi:hypothetical protein
MMRGALLVALLVVLVPTPCWAGAAEHDFQLWPGLQTRLLLTDRVSAGLLLQLRFGDDASQLRTPVVRSWLAAKPLSWLELAVGYDFIPLIEPVYVAQHRAWPQITLARRWAEISASNRTRLELRFIEGLSTTALRIRNGTRLVHSLRGGPWYGVLNEEFFFHLNHAGPIEPGFAENRLFLGAGRRLADRFRVEGGYQMRYLDLPGRDEIQHTLLFTVSFAANQEPLLRTRGSPTGRP